MRDIKEGDVVTVIWSNGDQLVDATVAHVPCDTGDMWYFKSNGNLYVQNPQSSNLDIIIKKEGN